MTMRSDQDGTLGYSPVAAERITKAFRGLFTPDMNVVFTLKDVRTSR